MTTTKVALAQAELDAAKREAVVEQRKRDLATLQAELKKLREKEQEFKRMEVAILADDGRRNLMQAEVSKLNSELSAHVASRPEFSDLLPDDEEVISWNRVREQLIRERDAALVRLRAGVPGPSRQEAIALNDEITHLRRVCRNLGSRLRGEFVGGGWKSSLSSVR